MTCIGKEWKSLTRGLMHLCCHMAAYGPIDLGGPGGGIGWGGDVLSYDISLMERVDFVITGPASPST